MAASSTTFKIWAAPLRGWPVRGLHVLVGPSGPVPGIILTNEQFAREVQQRLLSLELSSAEFIRLCANPEQLRRVLNDLFPDFSQATVPPEVARFLEILEQIGWSQAKLARKLQLDPNTVSRWVTGRTPVPTWALEYLAALKAIKDLSKALDL